MGNRTCSVGGCERPVYGRGMCGAHYGRWWRHGDCLAGRPTALRDRFFAKVRIDASGCWLWQGRLFSNGYGTIRDAPHRRLAHRVAYELLVGPVPDGLVLDHLCRVRRCVNPAHLEAVTQGENVRRGVRADGSPVLRQACGHGHLYSAESTHITPSGQRRCRICDAQRARDRRAAQRAARLGMTLTGQ